MDFAAQLRRAAAEVEADPARLPRVLAWYASLAEELRMEKGADARLQLAQVLIQTGNVLARAGTSEALRRAVAMYAEAVGLLRPLAGAGATDAAAELAGALGNGAHLLQALGETGEASLWAGAAADCFQSLPWASNARYAHNLAAACLNQARIQLLGGATDACLESCSRALQAANALDAMGDPRAQALAAEIWLQRGNALHDASPLDALQAYQVVIEKHSRGDDARAKRTLAAALANSANLALQDRLPPDACLKVAGSARRALDILAPFERRDWNAAETGITARWALCRALGSLLRAEERSRESLDLYSESSDAVESALDLCQHWAALGGDLPEAMLVEFFRFGCDLYRRLDPQFLGEFVGETLAGFAGRPALESVAAAALSQCINELESSQPVIHGSEETERLLDLLRRLRELRGLAGIPPTAGPAWSSPWPRTGIPS